MGDGYQKLARMCVVNDLTKPNYDDETMLLLDVSDVRPLSKPESCHGFPCTNHKMKKEGFNKDRQFFCCPNDKKNSCSFFKWVPEKQNHVPYQSVAFDTTL